MKKNSPGCTCCGETCAICADDFTRANDTDIDTGSSCGWTELTGTWDITSNELRCTSAGIAICDAVHPTDSTMVVEVDFKHSAASFCNVIVGYVDDDNYYYAEYNLSIDAISIVKVAAGVPTSLTTKAGITLVANQFYTAKVCVNEAGNITAYLDSADKVTCSPQTITGTQCGLEGGPTGTATFDNFSFAKSGPTCEVCELAADCFWCDALETPFELEVVVTGITDGTDVGGIKCEDCEALNGTYYPVYDHNNSVGEVCIWRTPAYVPSTCATWELVVSFSDFNPGFSGGRDLRVFFAVPGATTWPSFTGYWAAVGIASDFSDFDCLNWNETCSIRESNDDAICTFSSSSTTVSIP